MRSPNSTDRPDRRVATTPTDDDPISDEWWAPLLAVEAPMGESDGSYRRLESLEEGIDGVGLRELPRFRPDRGMTSLDRRALRARRPRPGAALTGLAQLARAGADGAAIQS